MEGAFADIMQQAQPATALINLKKTLLHDAWNRRFSEAERGQDEVKRQLALIERTTQGLWDRLIGTTSPSVIYQNGGLDERLAVLRLAFAEPLRYGPNGAYGTPNFSFPFLYLSEKLGQESEMVLRERIELSTSPLPRECSTTELPQPFVSRSLPGG